MRVYIFHIVFFAVIVIPYIFANISHSRYLRSLSEEERKEEEALAKHEGQIW